MESVSPEDMATIVASVMEVEVKETLTAQQWQGISSKLKTANARLETLCLSMDADCMEVHAETMTDIVATVKDVFVRNQATGGRDFLKPYINCY